MTKKKFLGFDIGGTNVAATYAELFPDGLLKIIDTEIEETKKENNAHFLTDQLIDISEKLGQRVPVDEVDSIAASTAGPLDKDKGILDGSTNIRPNGIINLAKPIKNHFGKEFKYSNDANCGGLIEQRAGAGKGARCLIYYTISTGIGWSLINDGDIVEGARGNTEGGHVIVNPKGPLCNCGNRGCLELYSSGPAIVNLAKAYFKEKKSILWQNGESDLDKITTEAVFDAKRKGDKVAISAIETATRYLALHVANMATSLNPDVIVFGGGVSKQEDYFLVPLKGKMKELTIRTNIEPIKYFGRAGLKDHVGIAAPFSLLMPKGKDYCVEIEPAVLKKNV